MEEVPISDRQKNIHVPGLSRNEEQRWPSDMSILTYMTTSVRDTT